MNTLRQTIEEKAKRFAVEIVNALRGASIEELLSVTGGRPRFSPAPSPQPAGARVRPVGSGRRMVDTEEHVVSPERPTPAGRRNRLARRSPEDIANRLQQIVSLLEGHPDGMR